MNNPELLVLLGFCAALMCLPIAVQMKRYRQSPWKSIVISAVLVISGLVFSRFWYFVENGYFRGRSFYGVIFFAPLVYWPVAKLLRMPYSQVIDSVAPPGCLTLAMVKVQCLQDGCCSGMILYQKENYDYVIFPSQIVEMTAFLLIAVALFLLGRKPENRGRVFPLFLLLYGGSRFVLDFFREIQAPYALGLSAGSFWSVIAVALGLIWLSVLKKKAHHTE
jgi:prolipoprotein diacylglyceryltransferase